MPELRSKVHVLAAALIVAFACISIRAQSPATVNGDFNGTLGPLSLKLHIKAAPDGSLTGTLDSPNQGANGIPCSDFVIDGNNLSFKVPVVNGTWKGLILDGGASLAGTWSQGRPMPLVFSRDTFVPAAKPSAVDGIWLGTSDFQGRPVRTQVIVESSNMGEERCTVDSLDLNMLGLACANVTYSRDDFGFDVPFAKAGWRGKLSADGKSLSGTWTPTGSAAPPSKLDFKRESQRIEPARAGAPAKFSPAMAPVSAAEMQGVLRRDLEKTLATGLLAQGKPTGIAIAVVRNGERSLFTFGTAKTDSMFEIGSITKTFTGLILAQMVEQGKVKPETPVRELLPAGTVAKPAGTEITLLDLVTQHSGLPRMPDNFTPADMKDPYVDYRAANLYQFIGTHGVEKPRDAAFLYSNLGFGLLGQALANRANTPYPALVRKTVFEPLGLKETAIELSAEQSKRFIAPYTADLKPSHPWNFVALAGAGAIRSTASDMLKYLEANMDPSKHPALSAAFKRSHGMVADVGPDGSRIGYAWIHDALSGIYWHDGGTGGFSSFALFDPTSNYAAIVLVNVGVSARGSFADTLGHHIQQRFAGKPAVSLDDW
jgi:serine-type D-Ala-D-Ala carboxypeptidase/endopeptidase